jgi:type II secretory ATPase GspE/PulE/Tfp pilus assembly ATPase PilB-like protein
VPLLDLDVVDLDCDVLKLVDEKLLTKHRILPILQRGKRLFIAVCDPTNLHALDEIKFHTTLRIEAVVVEQDKLDTRVVRAIEAVNTTIPKLENEAEGFEALSIRTADLSRDLALDVGMSVTLLRGRVGLYKGTDDVATSMTIQDRRGYRCAASRNASALRNRQESRSG